MEQNLVEGEQAAAIDRLVEGMQAGRWPGLALLPAEFKSDHMSKSWEGSLDAAQKLFQCHFAKRWSVYEMSNADRRLGWVTILCSQEGIYVSSARGWREEQEPQTVASRSWFIAMMMARVEELRGISNDGYRRRGGGKLPAV